jgi:hypothetical protein
MTFVLLYSIIAYFLYGSIKQTAQPLNLLEQPSQVVYGSLNTKNNGFEVNSDEIGVALILFSTTAFNAKEYSHLNLAIEGLPSNYQAKLVFVTKEVPRPVELSLLQPNGNIMTNLLVHDSNWDGEIELIGLRILPQDELGLSVQLLDPIKIYSLELSNNSYIQNYFTLLDYWLDYEPWKYLSISHLEGNQLLPIYAQPVVFIMIWLALCLLIYYLFIKKKLNVLLIIISWLVLDLLFINNMNANNNWVKTVYSSEEKIMPDDELFDLANKIRLLIGSSDNLDMVKNNKIFILSTDKYRGLRLVYHLLPLNTGYLGGFVPNYEYKNGDYILSYDIPENIITPEQGVIQQNGVSIKIEELSSGNNYIFMKVVH